MLLDKTFILRLPFPGNVHRNIPVLARVRTHQHVSVTARGQAKSRPTLGRQTDFELILEAKYFEES